jgi:hypothetical protein
MPPKASQATLLREPVADEDTADLMRSMRPDAIAWRGEQAEVDADIEGLARDEGADALVRRMDAEGVPLDEQRERLRAYFMSRCR